MTISRTRVSNLITLTGETFAWNTYTITNTATAYGSVSTYTSTATTVTGKLREVTGAEVEQSEGFYHRGDMWVYVSGSNGISDNDDFTIDSVKRKIIDHIKYNFAGTRIYDKYLVRRID